jgi:hypothetical protein
MIDAYAAGLIDGEGTVYIDRNLSVRLEVQMTQPAIQTLRWLQRNYGGIVKKCRPETERWAASYRWTQFSDEAIATLRCVLPWLQIKRPQAETAIEAQSVRGRDKRTKWTAEQRRQVETLRDRMLLLNRKGPETGPDPFAPSNGTLIAQLAGERWTTAQMDLFSDQGFETFSGPWPTSGCLTAHGVYSIPGISECPSGGDASSSLRDVLLDRVPKRFFLSPRAAAGILRRAEKRGRTLPEALSAALSALAENWEGTPLTLTEQGHTSQTASRGRSVWERPSPRGTGSGSTTTRTTLSSALSTPPVEGRTTTAPRQRTSSPLVRRLTPTECERLQAFPDQWTVPEGPPLR